MKLLLIRHAETVDNVAGLYAGVRDSVIVEREGHARLSAGLNQTRYSRTMATIRRIGWETT
jgi:broad specificity phosphatase PhoE